MKTALERVEESIYVPRRTGEQWVRADLARELAKELDEATQLNSVTTRADYEMQMNRDAWKACAEKLAAILDDSYSPNSNTEKIDALAEFERLKGTTP